MNPIIPFFWGFLGILFGDILLSADTVWGYILGVPSLVIGFISLKELGKIYIFKSTSQLFIVGLVSLFLSMYLANIVEMKVISRILVALGGSVFIASMVPLYYRFFK